MRTAVAALFLAAAAAAGQPDAKPLPPTPVTLRKPGATLAEFAAALPDSTGVTVAVDPRAAGEKYAANVAGVPFWEALEQASRATKTKLVVTEGGRKVTLEPRGASRTVSAASGAFRVEARQVVGRALLDAGETAHEVRLDVHWEPRMPVYRIDARPRVTKATDDRGTALTPEPPAARVNPTGATTDVSVALSGLTRESKRIAVLAGELRVTAAEKLLAFKFDDLAAKKPAEQTLDRVTARLKPVETLDDNSVVVELELAYPKDHPAFESFEEQKWLRDNRLRLVSPGGARTFDPDGETADASGPRVAAKYRFKADPAKGLVNPTGKGWSLIYEAPSPLAEFKVPFELRDIPIP